MEEKKNITPAKPEVEAKKVFCLTKRASLTVGKRIYRKGVEYAYNKDAWMAIPKKYQDFFEVKE